MKDFKSDILEMVTRTLGKRANRLARRLRAGRFVFFPVLRARLFARQYAFIAKRLGE